jgi:iron complex outermembrane receptor protein
MSLRVKGRSHVIDVLLTAAIAIAGTIPAFATETHQFDVPAEDAPTAIRDFASQAHVQILVAGENVSEKRLHPVSGEFSTEQGLQLLLADSGLSPQYVGDRSIALIKASDLDPSLQANAKEGNGFRTYRSQ